jgi:hypothetical protein
MTEKELSGKKKLIKSLEKYELSFEEKYPQEDMEVEFSKQYEVYMEKLLSGKIPKRRKYFNTVGKRIAACVAAAMLIFGGSMTVKAFREPVVEFFTNVYEKIVEIFFNDDDIAKAPSEIETVYTLGYVPEGYEMESFKMNGGKTMVMSVFTSNEDEIVLRQHTLDGKFVLDNEYSKYQYIYIDNIKVAIIEKSEEKMLYWNTSEYSFMLSVELEIAEEECIKIISSIAEKDR